MSALVMPRDTRRRIAGVPVVAAGALALMAGIVIGSNVIRTEPTPVTGSLSSLATAQPGPDAARALSRTSSTTPFPIRWQLRQPIPYTDGRWIFAGFVTNNFASPATNIRLEISFPSGAVIVHPIASNLLPGESVQYELRLGREDIDGWQARARFALSEWPGTPTPSAP